MKINQYWLGCAEHWQERIAYRQKSYALCIEQGEYVVAAVVLEGIEICLAGYQTAKAALFTEVYLSARVA